MTKKDFELIADAVAHAASKCRTPDERAATRDVAYSLARNLLQSNPRFDHDRFMAACGVAS